MNPEVLKGWFGVMGYTLSAFARGLDQTPVAKQDAHSAIKSVGNSATTPRDLTTDEDVWLMLVLLSESVAMRMRDLGSKCNVVEMRWRICTALRKTSGTFCTSCYPRKSRKLVIQAKADDIFIHHKTPISAMDLRR